MNRKHYSKWLGASLAILLVFAAGCSNNGNNSSSPTAPATAETPSATQPSASEGQQKEELTLSVWPLNFTQSFPSGIQEDPVAKDIQAKLNIKMDLESSPTDEKFQAMLASGDLSDVIIPTGTNGYIKQLIEGDNIIDLEPYLEQYAPDILKNAADAIAFSKKYRSNGTGKLYFLPVEILPEPNKNLQNNAIVGPFLRWDYYQEIGSPALNTYDDYLNAVAEMLKKHPTNEEGQPFFGFSQWFDWDIWAYATFPSWMEGKNYSGGGLYQVDQETLEFESMLTSENSVLWKGVDFWNKAYKMGLLDPDALTQKYDTAIQKGSSNRVLAAVSSWQLRDSNALLANAGHPDKGYTGVPIPMGDGKNIYSNISPFGNYNMWAVSKNAKSPERAIEFINYFYNVDNVETLYNGIKGVDWTEENGKKSPTEAFVQGKKTDPKHSLTTGADKYGNMAGLARFYSNPETGETLLIQNREDAIANLSVLDKSIADHYGVELPNDIFPQGYKPRINKDLASYFMPSVPDDIKRINDKVLNYMQAALAKMVLTKDETKYLAMKQEIIVDVQAMGYDTALEWYRTNYEQAKTNAAEFVN